MKVLRATRPERSKRRFLAQSIPKKFRSLGHSLEDSFTKRLSRKLPHTPTFEMKAIRTGFVKITANSAAEITRRSQVCGSIGDPFSGMVLHPAEQFESRGLLCRIARTYVYKGKAVDQQDHSDSTYRGAAQSITVMTERSSTPTISEFTAMRSSDHGTD